MKNLIAYLRENLILDFQGDLTMEMIRDFLKDDDSRETRTLLAKMVEERGVHLGGDRRVEERPRAADAGALKDGFER